MIVGFSKIPYAVKSIDSETGSVCNIKYLKVPRFSIFIDHSLRRDAFVIYTTPSLNRFFRYGYIPYH